MRYSIRPALLLIVGVFVLTSCKKVKTYDHFVDGYMLTQFDRTYPYSFEEKIPVLLNIEAHQFDQPEEIRGYVNEIVLDNFSYENGFARSESYVNLQKEGSIKLLFEYDGLRNTYSSILLPVIPRDSLVRIELDGGRTQFKWPKLEMADYYNIAVVEEVGGLSPAHRIVWDTVLVDQIEIELEDVPEVEGPNGNLLIVISAVRGPNPEIGYYNMEGEIPGRLLVISQIIETLNSQKRNKVQLRKASKVVADYIVGRYKGFLQSHSDQTKKAPKRSLN